MVNPDSIPRYEQHKYPPEVKRCCYCVYCKELTLNSPELALVLFYTACVYNIFHAVKLENLLTEDIVRVRPLDEACNKYKEADSV